METRCEVGAAVVPAEVAAAAIVIMQLDVRRVMTKDLHHVDLRRPFAAWRQVPEGGPQSLSCWYFQSRFHKTVLVSELTRSSDNSGSIAFPLVGFLLGYQLDRAVGYDHVFRAVVEQRGGSGGLAPREACDPFRAVQ